MVELKMYRLWSTLVFNATYWHNGDLKQKLPVNDVSITGNLPTDFFLNLNFITLTSNYHFGDTVSYHSFATLLRSTR